MSPRTIGAVGEYYENLLTSRALFSSRPQVAPSGLKLPQGAP
jgi:hypothetical protein